MPRGPRDDAPGVVHHVMVQGIERRRIFADDRDREELLRRLSRLVLELGFLCLAWAFMPNHFHLLVRSPQARISRLMARLGTGYARYFNARHDRVGHLFRNRFESRRARDEADAIGLVLYVCRNPFEAGLAPDPIALESYAWCAVGALTGRRDPYPFESVRETLALFDPEPSRARERLRAWLGIPCEPPFVRPPIEVRRSPPANLGQTLDAVILETCGRLCVEPRALLSRRRGAQIAAARALVAARAAQELGLSGAQIAKALGVTPSAVTRMWARAEREGLQWSESRSQ